ncbi:LCP family protein [Cellulomonas gilvus]|uniref:Cell envelope-related transcriptional attenuator n=1 Tax=Cellulomonas gilvus (strain ATCC 13127 / NRRL B-14078) TaxID=593907 RepID=F8A165_CELGA|nr:LCP family protein [Cellulomonas gilvus]AEI11612.1 cell envelope-related transcriptional attenuator [Cellulomonas gilvus ATCC 13127]
MRGTALVTVALLAFGGTAVYATYERLNGNINHVEVDDLLGDRPERAAVKPGADPDAGKPVNLLLLGSDSREGENGDIGGRVAGGMRSDTTIVLHISADRSRVELVSIPRDSMVAIPSCTTTDGQTTGASDYAMFNEAFARGWDTGLDLASAAACTWKTVEANTGVRIDDFLLVDFAGFQNMVDAIGGVKICIPADMDDEKAKLHIDAGMHTLDGRTALAFARSRHSQTSDGSDIGRIGNQQRLLAAIASQTLSKNVLTDWTDLLGVLNAATKSLTTSMQTSDLAGLAYSARSIRTGNIAFMTIPWGAAPTDKNRVEWTPEADIVWANLASDTPMLTGTQNDPGTAETTAPTKNPSGGTKATQNPGKTPKPQATKKAGRDSFTLDDNTGSC